MNKALRLLRVYHNLKQKDLAEKLGLSPSYVCEIESGTKQVTMETLQKYSDAFNVPTSSILYFAEHMDERGQLRVANPIARKALKMLEWLDTISDNGDHRNAPDGRTLCCISGR